jgi:hypothetical protein
MSTKWATRYGVFFGAVVVTLAGAVANAQQPAPAPQGGTPAPDASIAPQGTGGTGSGTAATSTTPATATTSATSATSSTPIPPDYTIKLKELEQRVNALKEKIHESKARLIQLQEVVLHGTIAGAKAALVHRNELGSSFKVERLQYALDASPIFNRVDQDGDLNKEEETKVFEGSIVPGNHQISVYIVLRGNGFGIFSYLNNYRLKIKSSYTFNAEEGKLTTVNIVMHEKDDITILELKDRVAVDFRVERKRAMRGGDEAAPPAAATPGDSAPPTTPAAAPTGH